MGRRSLGDPDQLGLFTDASIEPRPIPIRPRVIRRRIRRRPPTAPKSRSNDDQLALFEHLPTSSTTPPIRALKHRLRRKRPQTYIELAQEIGLMRLQHLMEREATYYMLDALPLQDGLHVETLLEARYRLVAYLQDAFADVADLAPESVRQGWFSLWSGRHPTVSARDTRGETLSLAIATPDARVEDPFRLRLRGLPGFLGYEPGPPPMEEGEELLSLYDQETLYSLLPLESQPMSLDCLLHG